MTLPITVQMAQFIHKFGKPGFHYVDILTIIMFDINDYTWKTQSVLYAFVIDMSGILFSVDLYHTSQPTYTNKIFLLIDWTGPILILGTSVVYLFLFVSEIPQI